ncbi:LOW QUALITY PROTEIN: hypothetical protein KUTeg_003870 [Tegillarca granosa]|uniref:Helicase C-terminal domain-containing protein n=1 Tax=Tegillarca granosa TaxID=220873 RepID=A0ABQ9FNA1_TEGGR|nr:LOW QUALITY PROTEIN: hypothetical protein KUTeg_003870 [Tegillarca granosa]
MATNIKIEEESDKCNTNGQVESNGNNLMINSVKEEQDEHCHPSMECVETKADSSSARCDVTRDDDQGEPTGVCKESMPKLFNMLMEKGESSGTHQSAEMNEQERGGRFHVNRELIPAANIDEQNMNELLALGLDVFNQEDFEQGVMEQIDHQLAAEEEERKKKALEKGEERNYGTYIMVQRELIKIDSLLNSSPAELLKSGPGINKRLEAARRQKENKLNQLKKLKARNKSITAKLNGELPEEQGTDLNQVLGLGPSTSQNETERERMIRLGEMTPFGTVTAANNKPSTSTRKHQSVSQISLTQPESLLFQDSAFDMFLSEKDQHHQGVKKKLIQKKNKDDSSTNASSEHKYKHVTLPHNKKDNKLRKIQSESSLLQKRKKENFFDAKDKRTYRNDVEGSSEFKSSFKRRKYPRLEHNFREDSILSDEEEFNNEEEGYVSIYAEKEKKKKLRKRIPIPEFDPIDSGSESDHNTKSRKRKSNSDLMKSKDDGDDYAFEKRLKNFNTAERLRQTRLDEGEESISDEDEEFDGGLHVPGRIWCKLFKKQGVRWLWELHQQEAGGIIGDEMGLGKTIQMIAFLAALRQSKLQSQHFRYIGLGPTLIVCPTTVMHQWVKEFHKWWPLFRVGILHSSGTFTSSEMKVTKYVTQMLKLLLFVNRTILKELWSLFDFVFPGKLGTLPDFMTHFSVPIVQGGYANASQIQVTTAYKCACVLRDTINPYLLRRMKADVNINLPSKNEQVLFCRLADEQREVYKEYLQSRECQAILSGKFQIFAGLITLRKICNHPDLSTGGPRVFVGDDIRDDETLEYGYCGRSGKMIVVESLLRLWKMQGHRVVLFSQSRSMLDILESYVQKQEYNYLRMDGGTSIASRQPMIDRFNKDKSIYVFLLTTKVGGLGVNLVGANRVIIFDPDWNPSTDTQARERTWRIGQKRNVTIYRLITSGTIEEKIYHRQIFKQFLANRILKDPKQRRFFKANDMYELFDLGIDDCKGGTETAAIFAGTGSEVKRSDLKSRPDLKTNRTSNTKVNRFDRLKEKKKNEKESEEEDNEHCFEDSEVTKMRELAKMLSQKLVGGSMDVDKSQSSKAKDDSKDVCSDFVGKTLDVTKRKSSHSEEEEKDKSVKGEESSRREKRKKKHKKKRKDASIQGALKHDVIMDPSKHDYVIAEAEAEKVAKEAVAALKRSRSQCASAMSGLPTWTGQHGGISKKVVIKNMPRFGQKKNSLLVSKQNKPETLASQEKSKFEESPSTSKKQNMFDGTLAGSVVTSSVNGASENNVMTSNELLVRMKQRNEISRTSAENRNEDDNTIVAVESKDFELLSEMRNFIMFECNLIGQASTQELLDKFGSKLPPSDSVKFKAMLNEICDFERNNNIGFWKLRGEFR